ALKTAETERGRAEDFRVQAERASAMLTLERGLTLCEQGEAGRGMLLLAHSLKNLPAEERDVERVIRANLAAWRGRASARKAVLRHEGAVTDVAFSPDGRTVLTVSARWSDQRLPRKKNL